MKPPTVYAVTIPSAHIKSNTTAIVHNIVIDLLYFRMCSFGSLIVRAAFDVQICRANDFEYIRQVQQEDIIKEARSTPPFLPPGERNESRARWRGRPDPQGKTPKRSDRS